MKRRLSASIDEELLASAERAVRDGRAPSVSALVEDAIAHELERTARLQAMDTFVASFQDEFGAFQPGEAETLASGLLASSRSADEAVRRDAA
jgi:Arc/MetJ-type ribon-helix-helix transcriptional regulator